MRHVILGLLAFSLFAATAVADDAADLKALQGTWKLTDLKGIAKEHLEGVKLSEVTVTIADDKLVMEGLAKMKREFTIKLDSTKKPRALDMMSLSGSFKGKTSPAIYELKDDALTICMPTKNISKRPTEFKAFEDTGVVVMKFQREKKK